MIDIQSDLATGVLGVDDVIAECERHHRLDRGALTALAPTATDGHVAHLVLYSATHSQRWLNGTASPPPFVTRTKTGCNWTRSQGRIDSPQMRSRLTLRARAGSLATSHLVTLAEPMIRHVVRALHCCHRPTSVVGREDMLNVARAAVAQGIWAFEPSSQSGPYYLRAWIEEHVRRDIAAVACPVSLPTRTHRRFLRIIAIRATLTEQLGRPPTDQEILAHGGVSQGDIDDERTTRRARSAGRFGESATSDVIDETTSRYLSAVETRVNARAPGWRIVLESLHLSAQQLDIIARHVGLPPYEHLDPRKRTERSIAGDLGLTRSRVRATLAALRGLADPGTRLHQQLQTLSTDDLEGLGLQTFANFLQFLPA